MFEKTLSDVVSGIRSSRRDTALYISQCISEIKSELQSADFFVKANALSKLTFLQMMGYTMTWAGFACVEVMSSPRFALKRVGYLAACQGFGDPEGMSVVLLTINLLKKELRGANLIGGSSGWAASGLSPGSNEGMYHAGLAINCLSNIVTEDLGRELLPELLHLLNHPSPYVRKKALLCLYKVFLKYPQGLRLSFDKIKLCLDDSHPSVVSCAVNVITELSDKNPKNYLPLAPAFFKLLTSSANNWMLIKVVKLLGSLVPEEPRLARKLLDPLSNIVTSTHAKSLLYEAVYATTLCLQYVRKADGSHPPQQQQVVDLCAATLRTFVQDSDQNLKYLGLVGFGSLLLSQPKALHNEHKGLILACLCDDDVTIRTRALGLLHGMATQRNLTDLVQQLLTHVEAASGTYRCDLVDTILTICASNKYDLVKDFEWYLDVLMTLARVRGIEPLGDKLGKQLMDVTWRVLTVRTYAVQRSMEMLLSRRNLSASQNIINDSNNNSNESETQQEKHILPEVLPAVAWITGEYSHLIQESTNELLHYDAASKGPYHSLIQSMTSPTDAAGIDPLPPTTQAVFLQNAMKVFAAACQTECSQPELEACVGTLLSHLLVFMESPNVEVKERSFTLYQLLQSLDLCLPITADKRRQAAPTLHYLLTPEPMKPISAKAQRRKRAEPSSPTSVILDEKTHWDVLWFLDEDASKSTLETVSFTKQTTVASAETVSHTPRDTDPFYLHTNNDSNPKTEEHRFGSIQLDSGDESTKKRKKSKKARRPAPPNRDVPLVESDESDEEVLPKKTIGKEFQSLALVDLTTPLGEDDVFPKNEHYVVPERKEKKKKKGGKREKREKREKRNKHDNQDKDLKLDDDQHNKGSVTNDAMTGDLLGFDSVFGAATNSTVAAPSNPIDNAFNDLLGLEMTPVHPSTNPTSSGALTSMTPAVTSTMTPSAAQISIPAFSDLADVAPKPKRSTQLWQNGTIKPKSGTMDWNSLSLEYRTKHVKGNSVSASVYFRFINKSSLHHNVILSVGKSQSSLTSPPGSTVEFPDKFGPFVYDALTHSIKGTLQIQDGVASIKAPLPSTMHLSPTSGLTHDDVERELSRGEWKCKSVRLSTSGGTLPQHKKLVTQFLRAEETPPILETCGTLAANMGSKRVRALVKVLQGGVQVDVKCEDEALCKALCSDLKRLQL